MGEMNRDNFNAITSSTVQMTQAKLERMAINS